MSKQNKLLSIQDLRKARQQSGFVGREEYLALFRRNLELSLEDSRRRILFDLCGQAGVGKSTLLRQFHMLAEYAKYITAQTDETENTVLEVMARLAEQFEQQGYKLGNFDARYKVYRQKMHELETDPEAPQGSPALIGKTVAKTGLHLSNLIPGSGVVLDIIDKDALATQAGEWASFLAKKVINKDEIRLVREPVEVLTPLFLEDIWNVANKFRIALFFDSYERTRKFLDKWLRDILINDRYGEVPSNIIFIIAGQQELDNNHWASFENERFMVRLSVEPFTEEEARQYLAGKGISNDQVIDKILKLSERLPLLLVALGTNSPDDPNQVVEDSDTAVEKFLKWVEDPKRRQIALDVALSRYFNLDVLNNLREEEADKLFSWLKEMPFVKERIDGWAYHDMVRTLMLRHKRRSSPHSWAELHIKLADYHDIQRNSLQLSEETGWHQDTWQKHQLNAMYHRLCQSPQKQLAVALNEFLIAIKNQSSIVQMWAETIIQAGKDSDAYDVEHWGKKLIKGLKACEEEMQYEVVSEMFTALLEESEIEAQLQPITLLWRGNTYLLMQDYDKAVQDFNKALELDSKFSLVFASRGLTYRLMNRYQEAIQDFDRAIELNSQYDWAIARRGTTYFLMNLYDQAIADYTRSIEINPKSALTFFRRGQVYKLNNFKDEAEKDFTQARKLDPELFLNINNQPDHTASYPILIKRS